MTTSPLGALGAGAYVWRGHLHNHVRVHDIGRVVAGTGRWADTVSGTYLAVAAETMSGGDGRGNSDTVARRGDVVIIEARGTMTGSGRPRQSGTVRALAPSAALPGAALEAIAAVRARLATQDAARAVYDAACAEYSAIRSEYVRLAGGPGFPDSPMAGTYESPAAVVAAFSSCMENARAALAEAQYLAAVREQAELARVAAGIALALEIESARAEAAAEYAARAPIAPAAKTRAQPRAVAPRVISGPKLVLSDGRPLSTNPFMSL